MSFDKYLAFLHFETEKTNKESESIQRLFSGGREKRKREISIL